MDVTCDRCSTEYEFEEALVSPRGTTVKCTQCGHLFKVFRLEHPINPQLLTNSWSVRRTDGSSQQLPSLSDLTRMISEGMFTRDDEVSRTGKAWRRLGDVEELEAFFAEADRRGPSRTRKSTAAPAPAAAAPERSSQPPPTAASPRPRTQSPNPGVRAAPAEAVKPANDPAPDPSESLSNDDEEVATEQRSLPGRPTLDPETLRSDLRADGAEPALSAPTPPAARIANDPDRTHALQPLAASAPGTNALQFPDLSERGPTGFDLHQRGRLLPFMLLAVITTAAASGIWFVWPSHPPPSRAASPPTEDPSLQFLARADASVATHRSEHFEEAITEYIKALAFHENDPHVLSLLSRVYAIWAQELRFAAQSDKPEPDKDKDKDKGKNAERRSDQLARNEQIQKLSDQAKHYAETAARRNPGNAEAEVALSDALRLTGNLVSARSELDRALATEHNPSAEMLRVAALLAIDEASGDARAGLQLASQAVAREPDLIRTQLLLARCLVRDGDLQGAGYHLRAVTTRDRDHPSALAVEQLISRQSDPAKGDDDSPEQGSKALTDAATPQFDTLSHESYITRGQTLLESGQVGAAKRMFEQALYIRPNSTQAHAGLGYVALEKGRPQLAAEHFVAAARAGNEDALIGLGDAYRRLQRPRDALRSYQNYLKNNPNGKQVSIARAQVERLSEELSQAKKAP